jgi:serine/threonine protein kinase
MLLNIGDTIADYEVLGVLGQGGMGAVYHVRNVLSGREEALKMVLPEMAADPATAERFLREIRVQASLQHPHIAAIRTAVRSGGNILMIMELINGVSVSAMLKKGPLRWDEAARILDDILSALAYAHAHGVVHRDVKPGNILVMKHGQSKLTDFGVARIETDDRITRTNLVIGSVHYMSPEQIQAQSPDSLGYTPLDGRADLYSLGATFYEMVTGRPPVSGANHYAILHSHLHETPVTPAELVKLPRGVSDCIMKALQKKPADRYQTAHEFQAVLRDSLFGGSSMPSGVETGSSQHELLPTATLPARLSGVGGNSLRDSGTRKTGSFSDATLETARQALADYMGPMAKVMVNRCAKTAKTTDELRQALAQEIEDEAGRTAFLKKFRS